MPVSAPGGRTTTHRFGRPSLVSDSESSTRSNPRTSTKNRMAGSYSATTMATRSTRMGVSISEAAVSDVSYTGRMTETPVSGHSLPPIVDRPTWQAKIDELRVKEKAHTRAGDALAAER